MVSNISIVSQYDASLEALSVVEEIINETLSLLTIPVFISIRISADQYKILYSDFESQHCDPNDFNSDTQDRNKPSIESETNTNEEYILSQRKLFFSNLTSNYLSYLHVSYDTKDTMVSSFIKSDASDPRMDSNNILPVDSALESPIKIPNFRPIPVMPSPELINNTVLYCCDAVYQSAHHSEYHVDLIEDGRLKKLLQTPRQYSTPSIIYDQQPHQHPKDLTNLELNRSISSPTSPIGFKPSNGLKVNNGFSTTNGQHLNAAVANGVHLVAPNPIPINNSNDGVTLPVSQSDSKLSRFNGNIHSTASGSFMAPSSKFNLTINTHHYPGSTSSTIGPSNVFNGVPKIHSPIPKSFAHPPSPYSAHQPLYSLYSNKSDLTLHKVSQIQTALEDNKSQTYLRARNPLSRINSPVLRRNFGTIGSYSSVSSSDSATIATGSVNISAANTHGVYSGCEKDEVKQKESKSRTNSLQFSSIDHYGVKSFTVPTETDTYDDLHEYSGLSQSQQYDSLYHLPQRLSPDEQLQLSKMILASTWTIVIFGVGSMFGVWKTLLGYDSSAVRYSLSYEKQTGYPISEYYVCLIFMTFFVAWVWCLVSWMGMKFYRHTKGGIASAE